MQRRQFLYGALALPLLTHAPTWAATRWREGPALPVRVQEIYPAVHNDRLYVAGGIARAASGAFYSRHCFSLGADDSSWRKHADLPDQRHHGQLASVGGQLYLFGGFIGSANKTWEMVDTVHRLTDDGWEPEPSLPRRRAEGVAGVSSDGALHWVTGQSPKGARNARRSHHIEVNDHWVFDASDQSWRDAAPIPTPRNSACGGWLQDTFVVTGGRTARGNLSATECYIASEDRWRSAAPLPKPQAGTASAVIDHKLFVFGGEIFVPDADVFADVWCYDLQKDTWSAVSPLRTPRHGLGAGVLDDEIYVIGGATAPGGRGTSASVEILKP